MKLWLASLDELCLKLSEREAQELVADLLTVVKKSHTSKEMLKKMLQDGYLTQPFNKVY